MNKVLKVLFIEDSDYDTKLMIYILRQGGYDPAYERVDTHEAMASALDRQAWDLIIADYVMPRFSGLNALKLVQDKGIDIPFIIVSGKIGEEIAVGAIKAGAHDYVLKDNLGRLNCVVEKELREAITRRKQQQAEERLKYLSLHDVLTGLYNRNYFEEEFNRLDVERQFPLAIIMGDINGLKIINDILGHQAGDKLLIKAAKVLKKACRKEDVICRWGGDEFAILLPKTNIETAKRICYRIRHACEKTEDDSVPLSFALGAATNEASEQSFKLLLKEAEDLMYQDKLLDNKGTRFNMNTYFQRTLAEEFTQTLEQGGRKRRSRFSSAVGR